MKNILAPNKEVRSFFHEMEGKIDKSAITMIYKRILATPFELLDEVEKEFPCLLTTMTINKLKKDNEGYLSGMTDEYGNLEKRPDYNTIKYMLERCYGKATVQVEIEAPGKNESLLLLNKVMSLPVPVQGDVVVENTLGVGSE